MSYRKLRRVLQQVVLGLLAIAAFGLAATSAFAQSTADIFYIYADHLNTPRAITNNVGQPVLRWDNVDPFGANAPNENPGGLGTFTCNLRFPGQYFDRETGVHYNYFRDYDPTIGRYIQADPIGLEQGVNLYGYAGANPISNLDSQGLFFVTAWASVLMPPSGSASNQTCASNIGFEVRKNTGYIFSPGASIKSCAYDCPSGAKKSKIVHAMQPCPRFWAFF